jgi:folate-binding protein YgfZ
MNESPLRDAHRSLGAIFREESGAEIVGSYGDIAGEALAVRTRAGVADLSQRGFLELTGRDRVRFLQAMVTNDVAACAPGQGTYAAFLNDRGRVVADAGIFVAESAVYLDVEPPARASLPGILERYIIMDDVTVSDASAGRVLLGVHGPGAREVVQEALETPLGDLAPFAHRRIEPAWVRRWDRFGLPGVELHLDPAVAPRIFAALERSGARPVGEDALTALRIKAGIPRAFVDMDESTIALEVGLEPAISRAKGCYLGQEVIVRAQDRGGVKRRLVGLALRGAEVPRHGAAVRIAEREVGMVTSAAGSISGGSPIALAIVHKEAWAPGTEVMVESTPATVRALPFTEA